MFFWRAINTGKITYTELHKYISLSELCTFYKIKDLQEELEQKELKKLKK